MTKNNSFKKQVRSRMKHTGETYKQAYDVLYNSDRKSHVLDYLAGFGLSPMNASVDSENLMLDQFFSGSTLDSITSVLSDSNNGMMLFAGKTASGKTMMMNAALNTYAAHNPDDRVISIDDSEHPETVLIPSNSYGLAFSCKEDDMAQLLKNAIRMRPDLISVGEIRNHEAAEISSIAAETGHHVMASVHALDFASAIRQLGKVDNLKVVIMQERFVSNFGLLALRYALLVTEPVRTVLKTYLQNGNLEVLNGELKALGSDTLEMQKEKLTQAGILSGLDSNAIKVDHIL